LKNLFQALESSALVELVRLLHHEQQPESVKKKALFAISALVRHFPFAQTKFGAAGGFNLLANLLHNVGEYFAIFVAF